MLKNNEKKKLAKNILKPKVKLLHEYSYFQNLDFQFREKNAKKININPKKFCVPGGRNLIFIASAFA